MIDFTYSRPPKIEHSDTVHYEIDMLRFTAERLSNTRWQTPRDAWVYLESFLLHYRALLDFFGKDPTRGDDLTLTNIWGELDLAAPEGMENIRRKTTQLLLKYEPAGGQKISKYVQHITMQRTEPKDWKIREMCEDIEPLLEWVLKHLPPKSRTDVEPVKPPVFTTSHLASNVVATHTASSCRLMSSSLPVSVVFGPDELESKGKEHDDKEAK